MYDLSQFSFITLTCILIVVGLFLKNWQPPIKRQYIAIILLPLGAILGHIMEDSASYGFLLAGFVFYREELITEISVLKDVFLTKTKQ